MDYCFSIPDYNLMLNEVWTPLLTFRNDASVSLALHAQFCPFSGGAKSNITYNIYNNNKMQL